LKLPVSRGALVQDVTEGSPADRAGLRPYDIVVSLDDGAIASDDDLIREISGRAPGSAARLKIVRDGQQQAVTVKLSERPPRETGENSPEPPASDRVRPDQDTILGLSVRELDRQTAERLEVPKPVRGVLITRVEAMSSSFDGGIERGTVLLEVNRQRVDSLADFRRVARAAHPGDILTFYVYAPDLAQHQLKTVRVDDR